MYIVIGVVVGLLVLSLLVVAHEFGHFLMARRNGVEVEEFGIGFPPKAVAFVRKDGKWQRLAKKDWPKIDEEGKKTSALTLKGKGIVQDGLILSLNWLPLGGFCQMKDENDASMRKGSFGRVSFAAKTKILFGGVAMNWLVAVIILTILALTGMPHFLNNQFEIKSDSKVAQSAEVVASKVMKGSPAAKSGMKSGDRILSMQAQGEEQLSVHSAVEAQQLSKRNAGKMVILCYERSGQQICKQTRLNKKSDEYVLGVQMSQQKMTLYRSTWSAPIVGVATTLQITGATFQGLGELVANLAKGLVMKLNFTSHDQQVAGQKTLNKVGDSVSGPVGIVGVLFPAFVQAGLTNLAFLTALITISLAVMNVLPIPALDGGRWLMIAVARLRGKKLNAEKEARIVGKAFLFLMILIVVITILDISRIIMR